MTPMSRRDLVFVMCRAIALFLLIPAFLDILTLPYDFFMARELSDSLLSKSFHLHQWLALTEAILGIAARLAAGSLFWRCGPRIEKLFANPDLN
jgi:hypothetical protein